MRRRRIGLIASGIVALSATFLVSACSPADSSDGATNVPEPSASANVNNSIDPATINRIADSVRNRGLTLTGERDVAAQVCAAAGCSDAYEFDQLTILKFPTTGKAELYNGSVDGAYQVLDLVVTFPPNGSAQDLRERYEEAIRQAVQ